MKNPKHKIQNPKQYRKSQIQNPKMTQIPNSKQPKYDLEERTLEFLKKVIRLCKKLPYDIINSEIIKQLIRAVGSIGANYREANESISKKDLFFWIDKHNKFSSREVKQVIKNPKSKIQNSKLLVDGPVAARRKAKERYYRLPIFLRAFLYFVNRYFLQLDL